MKTFYYIGANNEAVGPYSIQELAELANRGTISPETLVAEEGGSQWKRWDAVGRSAPLPEQRPEPVEASTNPEPSARGSTAGGATSTQRTGSRAGDQIARTSREALRAFKIFATNPVGGLPIACQSLDKASVLGVGIVFCLVHMVCALWALHTVAQAGGQPLKISLDLLLALAVPFVSIAAASLLVRTVFRGGGSLSTDCFIAGAVLLPEGFVMLAATLLGIGNIEVVALLVIFAVCLVILMLYSGCHHISQLSERAATFAVPIMLVASIWFMKVIYTTLLQRVMKELGPAGFDKFFN